MELINFYLDNIDLLIKSNSFEEFLYEGYIYDECSLDSISFVHNLSATFKSNFFSILEGSSYFSKNDNIFEEAKTFLPFIKIFKFLIEKNSGIENILPKDIRYSYHKFSIYLFFKYKISFKIYNHDMLKKALYEFLDYITTNDNYELAKLIF